MRLMLSLLMFLALAIGFACNNAAKPIITKVEPTKQPVSASPTDDHNHTDEDNVPRITIEEAKEAMNAGTAVFVDTRDSSSFGYSRIKGALHLPMNEFVTGWQKLPKGKKIIAYCS